MKFFISVDVEGISGIVDGSKVSRNQGDYERGRKLWPIDRLFIFSYLNGN